MLNLVYVILCSFKQAEADFDRALLLDKKVRFILDIIVPCFMLHEYQYFSNTIKGMCLRFIR